MELPASGGVHDQQEIDAIVNLLQTTKLAIGENVAEMERQTADLLSKKHGMMVNSGTSALRIAIDLLRLEPGDEIITSPLTFSSDVAPMVQSGIVPVFVDIDPDTFQLDASKIAEVVGPRTKAILTPNLCGNCPDWDAIRTVADEHGLKVVEDSADVLDSWQRGRRTGERSDISITSFALSHSITAGGTGGMVGIDDDDDFDYALALRRWGRRSEQYLFGSKRGSDERFGPLADGTPYDLIFVFDEVGYNFEPSELGAAYGVVQLTKLADFNARRQANGRRLEEFFATRTGVTSAKTTADTETTWMRGCFILDDDAPFSRTEMQEFLLERGIPTRMVWTGNILRQPGFANIEHRQPADGLPNCDYVMDNALSLPVYHALTADHMGYITEQLSDLFEHFA